jgi:transposase-like protein
MKRRHSDAAERPVEIDETYIGSDRRRASGHRGDHHERKVLSLVDRQGGRAKSIAVERVTARELLPIMRRNVSRYAHIMTDEGSWYSPLPLSSTSTMPSSMSNMSTFACRIVAFIRIPLKAFSRFSNAA